MDWIKLNIVATNCSDQMCADYRDHDAKPGKVEFTHVVYLPAFQTGINEFHTCITDINRRWKRGPWDLLSTLDCCLFSTEDEYSALGFYLDEIINYTDISNDVICDCNNMIVSPATITIIPADPKLEILRFNEFLPMDVRNYSVSELRSHYRN